MTLLIVLASVKGVPWTYWLGVAVMIVTAVAIIVLLVDYYRRVVLAERDAERWYRRARTS